MREIVPDVLTWTWWSERFGYDFNGYLVLHPAGNVCIDPVEADADTLAELARLGVARIVLTNRNHYRDAARVRERTGARVAVHAADVGFVREKGVVVDEVLVVGEHVGPFVVVDAAGKSPGEVALHWPERRLLVVGDACVGNPAGSLSLLPPAVIDDEARLRQSLRRLNDEVDFDTLLVCDGQAIPTGGHAALARLVSAFDGPGPVPVSMPRQR